MLKLTDNSKVKFKANHKNTFGLMYGLPENGGTCPGATTGNGGCLYIRDGLKRETCYMAKITAIYKQVGVVLADNTASLQGKTIEEMTDVCRATIQEFIRKNGNELLYFRLHYSGDFFSVEYAQAWATVIKEFPDVKFWVYTRSFREDFNCVHALLGIPNLTLFLSCDPSNYEAAFTLYDQLKDTHNNLGLAWLGDNAPDKEHFRWVTCPEVSGKVKNTKDAGACSKCRLCVDNYKIRVKNIHFPIH